MSADPTATSGSLTDTHLGALTEPSSEALSTVVDFPRFTTPLTRPNAVLQQNDNELGFKFFTIVRLGASQEIPNRSEDVSASLKASKPGVPSGPAR